MPSHAYRKPVDLSEALAQLAEPDQAPMGGGTDLLVTIEERVVAPKGVVDVRELAELLGVQELPDGGVRIGGAVRLADIAAHPAIRARYPALAVACERVGPPAVQATATLGGSLCQRPRCRYFRNRVPCHKNGGPTCPAAAADGENQYLALVEGGPCWIVHPSDPAVALVALEATIELASTSGRREVAAAALFVLPRTRLERETVLADGELLTGVRLSAEAGGGAQWYLQSTQRDDEGFALVSIAAARRADGEVRLVLGGVAPRPYRVYGSVEEEVTTGGLDEETIAGLAERALLDAAPLSKNGYKLELAESLVRDAIRALARD